MILKLDKSRESSLEEVEIQEYQFIDFSKKFYKGHEVQVKNYTIPDIKEVQGEVQSDLQQKIKTERYLAQNSNFEISPIVKEYRGIRNQEVQEYNEMIQAEVDRQLRMIKEEAAKQGYEEGQRQGLEEIKRTMVVHYQQELEKLQNLIEDLSSSKVQIINQQKDQIIELIKSVAKWIILKEVNEDPTYVARLLEKLILEIGQKDNLLVKVSRKAFEQMPEFLEILERKLGELRNIRIEADFDQEAAGIILESANGIIDGTFDSQMKNLDKIFESMVGHE